MSTTHRFSPNTVLPKGGRLLQPPVKRQIGGWVKMTYDATVQRHGLTWLRVQGGFGGRGDREDWVADLPSGSVSVSDYDWVPGLWNARPCHGTFDAAIIAEMRRNVAYLRQTTAELRDKADHAEEAQHLMETALASLP